MRKTINNLRKAEKKNSSEKRKFPRGTEYPQTKSLEEKKTEQTMKKNKERERERERERNRAKYPIK